MRIARTLGLFLAAAAVWLAPTFAFAGYFAFVETAPPPLPVYSQPSCPVAGYLWTPGYWAYGSAGYYWVPGVWVAPPRAGVLWTPGYWSQVGTVYTWRSGYWSFQVGYYGRVNYGFGYNGTGFQGGSWDGTAFRYSASNAAFVRAASAGLGTPLDRASFHEQGSAGIAPTAEELAAGRELRFRPTAEQTQHEQDASTDRDQLLAFNHGSPGILAMDSVAGHKFDQQGHYAEGARATPPRPAENGEIAGLSGKQFPALSLR